MPCSVSHDHAVEPLSLLLLLLLPAHTLLLAQVCAQL
jgi:hypothetical protein